ncbi:MAG: AMP-binding protein, partial [Deltaproteobacteria bacterium]
VRPTDYGVSWLPLYHDMGLIGSWLFCLFYAVPITILSPVAFLMRPERWLWAMSDSKATLCPAPNFSYELCARKIPDSALEGLDLSPWRIAINAGEAVHPDTLARFYERFKKYGFRQESYTPCYGLAESTVALAFPPIDRPPVVDTIRRDLFETEARAVPAKPGDKNVVQFVANGKPMPHHEIKIVDEQGEEVDERVQGRLFFRGLSRTSGYFRNPKATAAITTPDGWMDSGDLAYWANGEIHITGRVKDLIIKSGRNIVPQEVEAAVAEVPGVRRGCIAAFGLVDEATGTERLVVAAETRETRADELEQIETTVIEKIDAMLGIPPDLVLLVRPHAIPKTSSGKIRRNETRNLYLSGKLNAGKKAPWVQIVRLKFEHFDSWARLTWRHERARMRRAFNSALMFSTAAFVGTFARLAPGKKAAAQLVQSAARFLMNSSGEPVAVRGMERIGEGKPAVFVANRAGAPDPLVLASTLKCSLLLADSTALNSLPLAPKFLLAPLVVPKLNGNLLPEGGTMRERIAEALKSGHSVLVFPESALGATPAVSRYRLEVMQAAASAGCSIQPIGIRGTSELFRARRRTSGSWARIRFGDPIRAESSDHAGLLDLRERVREAVGKLCG